MSGEKRVGQEWSDFAERIRALRRRFDEFRGRL